MVTPFSFSSRLHHRNQLRLYDLRRALSPLGSLSVSPTRLALFCLCRKDLYDRRRLFPFSKFFFILFFFSFDSRFFFLCITHELFGNNWLTHPMYWTSYESKMWIHSVLCLIEDELVRPSLGEDFPKKVLVRVPRGLVWRPHELFLVVRTDGLRLESVWLPESLCILKDLLDLK